MTTPSADHSLHHCSLGSEKMMRAVDDLIALLTKVLSSSQSLSVGHVRTGRPVPDQFGSSISNVREKSAPQHRNEQIRILLERQRADARWLSSTHYSRQAVGKDPCTFAPSAQFMSVASRGCRDSVLHCSVLSQDFNDLQRRDQHLRTDAGLLDGHFRT